MAIQVPNPNPNPNPNPPPNQSDITDEATIEFNGSDFIFHVREGSVISDVNSLEFANELLYRGDSGLFEVGLYADACDLISRALQISVAHFGELAPECIHSYYKYGQALLIKARDESDSLGAMYNKKDLQKSATVEALKNNVDVSEKNEEDKDGESYVEEDKGEEDESDLDLAWKMLDIARAISEKHLMETSMEMVDILLALAEVSFEREEIDTSLSDYKKALSILEQLVEPDSRRIVELNFRICLTLEIGSRAEEAIPYCQRAMSLCKSRIQRLTDEVNVGISGSTSTSSPCDKQSEIEALSSMSSKLEKKLEDLQQLESNPRSILSDIPGELEVAKAKANEQGGGGGSAAGSNNGDFGSLTEHTNGTPGVTHLGVVDRGVKRVIMGSGNAESSSSKKPALEPKSDGGDNGGS